jgi:hypothetical protein
MGIVRRNVFVLAACVSVLVGVGGALLWSQRAPRTDARPAALAAQTPPRGEPARPPKLASQAGTPTARLTLAPTQASIPGVSLDPTAPDYDARKLIKLTGDLKGVYEAEPRNPAWADAVESRIGPALEAAMRAVLPHVSDLNMKCRSTMCEIHWNIADDTDGTSAKARHVALQLFPGFYGLTEDGGHIIRWDDLTWTGDLRDTDAFITQAKMQLDRSTARLKAQDLSWLAANGQNRRP